MRWGATVTEVRPRLSDAAMSISDHTLDALLGHLRDYDLPTILARLADQSESYSIGGYCSKNALLVTRYQDEVPKANENQDHMFQTKTKTKINQLANTKCHKLQLHWGRITYIKWKKNWK